MLLEQSEKQQVLRRKSQSRKEEEEAVRAFGTRGEVVLNLTEMFEAENTGHMCLRRFPCTHFRLFHQALYVCCGKCHFSAVTITWRQNLPQGLCELFSGSYSDKYRAAMAVES